MTSFDFRKPNVKRTLLACGIVLSMLSIGKAAHADTNLKPTTPSISLINRIQSSSSELKRTSRPQSDQKTNSGQNRLDAGTEANLQRTSSSAARSTSTSSSTDGSMDARFSSLMSTAKSKSLAIKKNRNVSKSTVTNHANSLTADSTASSAAQSNAESPTSRAGRQTRQEIHRIHQVNNKLTNLKRTLTDNYQQTSKSSRTAATHSRMSRLNRKQPSKRLGTYSNRLIRRKQVQVQKHYRHISHTLHELQDYNQTEQNHLVNGKPSLGHAREYRRYEKSLRSYFKHYYRREAARPQTFSGFRHNLPNKQRRHIDHAYHSLNPETRAQVRHSFKHYLKRTERNLSSQINHNASARVKAVRPAIKKTADWFRDNLSPEELKARSWITRRESGHQWKVLSYGGRCVGYFQLDPAYLGIKRNGHINLKPAHQVKVADKYVRNRYGNWLRAKVFWAAHHWY